MAIKIYGRLSSANVQKINWFCHYTNISVINLKISFDHFPNINNWYIKLKKMNSFQNTVISAPLPPN